MSYLKLDQNWTGVLGHDVFLDYGQDSLTKSDSNNRLSEI